MKKNKTKEGIEKFAFNHGNQFHARVTSLLRRNHWEVLVSPFYRDVATDKAREADIITEKEFIMHGRAGNFKGGARVRLVIECKFISKIPTVFWFDNKDILRAENRITTDTILKPRSENRNIENHHWYSEKEVGKVFAAFNLNAENKQTENELIFGAVDKVLNALKSYRSIDSIIPKDHQIEPVWPRSPTYPVIICNDFSNLYKMPFDGSEKLDSLARQKFFQIEVNYSYTRFISGAKLEKPEYFIIDVVDFNFLEEYINSVIKGDIEATGEGEMLLIKD